MKVIPLLLLVHLPRCGLDFVAQRRILGLQSLDGIVQQLIGEGGSGAISDCRCRNV